MSRRAMDVLTVYTWFAYLAMCCSYLVVHQPPGTPPKPDPSIVFVILVSIFWLTGIVAILVHCFVMLVFLVRRRRWFWLPLFIWFHFGSTIVYLRFRGEFSRSSAMNGLLLVPLLSLACAGCDCDFPALRESIRAALPPVG